MKSLLQNLFDFDREETSGSLLFFKLFELFVVVFTAQLAWEWGHYVLRISDVVLPLGIANYVDISFMFEGQRALWNAGAISVLGLFGFFRVWRGAYMAAFFLLHLQYAARFCLGEIPHSANMIGMTFLGLSVAMVVFREGRLQRRFTLGFTYFFVGLGYTLAAVCKLVATGITWVDGRHLWMWINEKGVDAFAKTGLLEFNAVQAAALDSHLVATAFLTVGIVSEFFAFLCWWRRWRTPVLLAVLGLHVGIYLSMNIIFKLSMYELVLLALPWAQWFDWLIDRARTRPLIDRALLFTRQIA